MPRCVLLRFAILMPLLLGACLPDDPAGFAGYVEGHYVLLAPEMPGRILHIPVQEGQSVAPGDLLVQLDTVAATMEKTQAQAAFAEAKSILARLESGGSPLETDALAAAVAALGAENRQAEADLTQAEALYMRDLLPRTLLEARQAAADLAHARLQEAKARLDLALAPSRSEDIDAQRHRVEAAQAALALADWRLSRHQIFANEPGKVAHVLRRPGEMAGPTSPVLSVLPEDGVRVVFFIREAERAMLDVGALFKVTCDGCLPMHASLTWIADGPEFTPPVIFSESHRQTLSWRAEARAEPGATLSPGQVVTLYHVAEPSDVRD